MSRKHRQGFTLIELLVVISIIALLISLLLPALGSARRTANIAREGTQIKGLLTSSHNYAADNNDYAPPRPGKGNGDGPDMLVGSTLTDFDLAPLGSAYLWGQGPGAGGDSYPNAFNLQYGLGHLFPRGSEAENDAGGPLFNGKFGDYSEIEMAFSPFDRNATFEDWTATVLPTMWARRAWFGDEWTNNWIEDGRSWQDFYPTYTGGVVPGGNANYYLDCSFAYRGADFTKLNFSSTWTAEGRYVSDVTATFGGFMNAMSAAQKREGIARAYKNGRTASEGWGAKAVMFTFSNSFFGAQTKFARNVGRGDGSVALIDDQAWKTQNDNINYSLDRKHWWTNGTPGAGTYVYRQSAEFANLNYVKGW